MTNDATIQMNKSRRMYKLADFQNVQFPIMNDENNNSKFNRTMDCNRIEFYCLNWMVAILEKNSMKMTSETNLMIDKWIFSHFFSPAKSHINELDNGQMNFVFVREKKKWENAFNAIISVKKHIFGRNRSGDEFVNRALHETIQFSTFCPFSNHSHTHTVIQTSTHAQTCDGTQ